MFVLRIEKILSDLTIPQFELHSLPGFAEQFLQHLRIGDNILGYIQIEEYLMCEMFAAILDQFEFGAFDETGRMKWMFVHGIFANTIQVSHLSRQTHEYVVVS